MSRFRKCSHASRRGLTLLDLTIAVMVMGVMGAVAGPRFSGMLAHYRLEAAAQRLQADLDFARHQALTRGQPQRVAFERSKNVYELPDSPHPDHPGAKYVVDLAGTGVVLKSAEFGNAGSVEFDLYGRPDAAGRVVLTSGGEERTLRLDGTTGRATIE